MNDLLFYQAVYHQMCLQTAIVGSPGQLGGSGLPKHHCGTPDMPGQVGAEGHTGRVGDVGLVSTMGILEWLGSRE